MSDKSRGKPKAGRPAMSSVKLQPFVSPECFEALKEHSDYLSMPVPTVAKHWLESLKYVDPEKYFVVMGKIQDKKF